MIEIKLIGAPGTGKTTALVSLYKYFTKEVEYQEMQTTVDDVVKNDNNKKKSFVKEYKLHDILKDYRNVDVNDIVFITFTTTAANVLRERGVENAYTLHSYVTRLLLQNKIIDALQLYGDLFPYFALRSGYGYDLRTSASNHPSNITHRLLSYYTHTMLKEVVKNDWDAILERIRKHGEDYYVRARDYLKFKREKNALDYDDVLIEFVKTKNVDYVLRKTYEEAVFPRILIVDEAQDLSPLEWLVVRKIAKEAGTEVLIIAGDHNQTVFEFQGSSPEIFMSFAEKNGHVRVLKKSHRLPYLVWVNAERITKALGTAVDYEPRESAGRVNYFRITEDEMKYSKELRDETKRTLLEIINRAIRENKKVFVLCRTNRLAEKIERELLSANVKTRKIKNAISQFETYEKIKDFIRGVFTCEDCFIQYITHSTLQERIEQLAALTNTTTYRVIKELHKAIVSLCRNDVYIESKEFTNVAEQIEELARQIIDNAALYLDTTTLQIINKIDDFDDANVYVDTFHAAKGEEADIVIVFDYVNKQIEEKIKKSKRALYAEARALYVAFTRAKEELYVFYHKGRRSILYNLGLAF